MQNLQIRYEESSAQLEYLDQYSLIEDEQIQHHSLADFQAFEEQIQFQENQIEENSQQESLTFQQYTEQTINLKGIKLFNHYECEVRRFLITILRDHLELAYHTKQIKINFSRYLWVLVLYFHAFLIFGIFVSLEWTVILIWAFVTLSKEQQICESEVEFSNNFKSSIFSLMGKLKNSYLDQGNVNEPFLKNLRSNLKSFINQLSKKYDIFLKEASYIIDQLNEIFRQIFERVKTNHYAQLFLTTDSTMKRKYYFWMLRRENTRLKNVLKVLQAIISLTSKNQTSKPSKYKRPITNKQIFYLNLLRKYEEAMKQQQFSAEGTPEQINILKIMRNELQFQYLFSIRINMHQTDSQNAQQKIEEIDQIANFAPSNKELTDSYYYGDDDSLTKYEPESIETIKSKLNELFKKKKEQQATKEKYVQQPRMLPRQKLQKSIFSFGIPLPPPKRDMAAFYIK